MSEKTSESLHTDLSPAQSPSVFDLMRRQLKQAEIVTSLLSDKFIDLGSDDDSFSAEDDPLQCYKMAASLIEDTHAMAEELLPFGVEDHGDPGLYSLKILYVRNHLSLLATKAGCDDFDRPSIAGLAQHLVESLLEELNKYAPKPQNADSEVLNHEQQ